MPRLVERVRLSEQGACATGGFEEIVRRAD
jgi:hypothetical protein